MSKRPSPIQSDRPRVEHARGELPPADPLPDELSAGDRALLVAARRELQQGHVPAAVRQRLFERVIDEVRRPVPNPVLPASPLVPVQARGVWLVLGSAAAMAFALVLLANARSLFRGWADAGDPLAVDAPPRPEQRLGDRIFQSALFRAPAPAWSGALPPGDANLFRDRPFSMQSRAWQVKHWNDLAAPPSHPAKHHFDQGALCVTLRSGERVVGGWPWLPSATDVPTPVPSVAAPPPVALSAGKAYRLVFKAWASEPLPSQLLIAVGHAGLPFSAAGGARVEVSTAPEPFVVSFIAKHDDPSVGVAFLANASDGAEPTRVCLSDVTLSERPR